MAIALLRADVAERIECPGCGRVQEVSPDREWCLGCARPLPGLSGGPSSAPRGHRSPQQAPLSEAAGELQELFAAGPSTEAVRAVEDVLQIEKRSSSLATLIPVYGLIAIHRSDVHSPFQKIILGAVSLAVTMATGWALWALLPSPGDDVVPLRARAREQMAVLVELANRARVEKGAYPDAASWRRNAEHADGRYFDPWGRPYLYDVDRDHATLRTLGRDGAPGGTGQDEDLAATIQPGESPLGANTTAP